MNLKLIANISVFSSLPMQSRLNTFFDSSSGTFGAARPCLASDDNADDDALDAVAVNV